MVAILVALLLGIVPTVVPAGAQQAGDTIILDGDVEDAVPEAQDDGGSDADGAAEEAEAAPDGGEPPAQAQTPPGAAPGARRPRAVAARMVLRSILFSRSDYLSGTELDEVRRRYLGRSVLPADLGGLVAAVDALYRERNILLARAVPTRIDAASGLVSIELQEARIGEVAGSGDRHIDQRYIAYRLGLAAGDLADNRIVDERVLRLSLTDNLPVQAQFVPGAVPGIVDLELMLAERAPVSVFATLDTFGKRATGVLRGTAGITIRSLTGWNDPLSVSGTVTEGSVSGSIGYSRVVHPLGTRLSIAADASQSRTLAAPVTRNRSYGVEVGLAHPFVVRRTMRVQGSVSALGFAEAGTISGAPLVDQHGYGGRLGASQFFNGEGWFASLGQTFTAIGWYDGIVGGGRIDHYALGANAAGAVALGAHHAFAVQAVGQLALNARAPSKYRLTVAGPGGVRGYDQDVSSGDSGVYLRAQIERTTPLPLGIDGVDLRPFAFADVGQAFDFVGGAQVAQDALASVGIGSTFALGRNLSGDIFAAKPLLDANGFSARGQYEVRGSVSVRF